MKPQNLKPALRELAARSERIVELAKLDLGESSEKFAGCAQVTPKQRWYPTLHIHDRPSDLPLPDEGTATITYKVTRRSAEKENGKERHSATIEVRSIETEEPLKAPEKKNPQVMR